MRTRMFVCMMLGGLLGLGAIQLAVHKHWASPGSAATGGVIECCGLIVGIAVGFALNTLWYDR